MRAGRCTGGKLGSKILWGLNETRLEEVNHHHSSGASPYIQDVETKETKRNVGKNFPALWVGYIYTVGASQGSWQCGGVSM